MKSTNSVNNLTRRELLAGAAAAGAAAALPGAASAQGLVPALASATGDNVVVIVLDSLRTDHVGAYGGRRAKTPTLDVLARESLVFTDAHHEGLPTVPVRKSVLIGRSGFPFRGWRPEAGLPAAPGWEGVHRGETTFLDVLERRGYLTGYVTDNPHVLRPAFAGLRRRPNVMTSVKGQIPGWRLKRGPVSAGRLRRHLAPELAGRDRGRVREYLGYNPADRRESEYLGARVFQGGIDFLERAAFEGRSFGLVIDCFDAHEPWDPPDSYLSLYARVRRGGYRPIQPFPTPYGRTADLGQGTLKLTRALYAAEVSFLDAWLGHFLTALEELRMANTWVVVLSDHGVSLGEHGWIGKQSNDIHGELLDVPMMIRHPQRLAAGRRTDYFASAHDVAPTLLRAVGAPVPKAMDGADLRPLFSGRRPSQRRREWVGAWGETLLAGDSRWLLVAENRGGRVRNVGLFDKRRDPGEHRNLAGQRRDVVRRLVKAIRREAGRKGLPSL
jgi:arylsulfatase A-like enzyme